MNLWANHLHDKYAGKLKRSAVCQKNTFFKRKSTYLIWDGLGSLKQVLA